MHVILSFTDISDVRERTDIILQCQRRPRAVSRKRKGKILGS